MDGVLLVFLIVAGIMLFGFIALVTWAAITGNLSSPKYTKTSSFRKPMFGGSAFPGQSIATVQMEHPGMPYSEVVALSHMGL